MAGAVDEDLVARIGRELFARVQESHPTTLSRAWWTQHILDWALRDPRFKTDLFRFVDVLPALRTRQAVERHVVEYFDPEAHRTPPPVEQLLARLRGGPVRALVAAQMARQVRRMAQQFIVGQAAADALPRLRKLWDAGLAFSLDVLGEACLSEAEAQAFARSYLELIPALASASADWPARPRLHETPAGPIPRANVSVKLSALYPHADPLDWDRSVDELVRRLRPIFRAARDAGVALNVDMEVSELKDLTLAVFERACDDPEFRDWPDAAIAVQAYLKSADADVERLCAWARSRGTPITVRLVKGAYWDAESIRARQRGWPIPVWETKPETDAAYERCARLLCAHYPQVRPAFASHNLRSLAASLAAARSAGLGPGALEIQMLYGMGEPVHRAVAATGERLRVYAPIGDLLPGMAYLVRRLLENTSNESFLVQRFEEHVSADELLRDPARLVDPSAPRYEPPPERWLTDAAAPGPFVNTPTLDFSRADRREAFAAALERTRERLGFEVPARIGGERRTTGRLVETRMPHDPDRVVARIHTVDADAVDEAVARAVEVGSAWGRAPAAERAAVLFRAADRMRCRRLDLAALQVFEVGKAWREADADVVEAIDFCEFYGREALRLGTPQRTQEIDGETNDRVYEPRGVAAVITPWNFPLAIPTGMTTAALVLGNPVVLKPAPESAAVTAQLVDILEEAGLPPGVLQLLPGPGETVGARLAAHSGVALIAFTGSLEVGLELMHTTGQVRAGQPQLKRLVCELGGKNAILVDEDADLDQAIQGILHSAFGYQGQKCSACSRVVAVGDVYEPLVARLGEAVRDLPVGSSEAPGTHVGPVIDARAREKIAGYVARARRDGLALLAEGKTPPGHGVAPAVFGDVPPEHPLAQQEVFGPVVAVIRARDFDEALRIANGTPYALTGGVYSRSPRHIEQSCREFLVGNLYVNRGITGAVVERQPFGGFRMSGIGSKAGGRDYLLQFCWPRTITENTVRRGFAPETGE